jgi:hypothetical protein
VAEVFCDDLRVSVPRDVWDELRPSLSSVLEDAGMGVEFETDSIVQWRCDGGTVKAERMNGVRVVSASGRALVGFRLRKQLGSYLAALGAVPHRVTGLHATLDVREPTPPVLDRLVAQAKSDSGLRAGRKRIPPTSLQRYVSYLASGVETGSLYCGGKGVEIRPVIYDKRQERIDRGMPDLGFDLTRYECRLRGVGATLRDAYDPTSIFWHYMAPDFLPLPSPSSVAPWAPAGEGFTCDRPAPLLPAQRLLRRVEGSGDFADIVRLAGAFPGGLEYLCALVRRIDHGGDCGVQGLAPAVTMREPSQSLQ